MPELVFVLDRHFYCSAVLGFSGFVWVISAVLMLPLFALLPMPFKHLLTGLYASVRTPSGIAKKRVRSSCIAVIPVLPCSAVRQHHLPNMGIQFSWVGAYNPSLQSSVSFRMRPSPHTLLAQYSYPPSQSCRHRRTFEFWI